MATPRLEALPFKEAIEGFRAKGYRATFDHQEMMGEEHAYSFTVAKAMQRDVLHDIRAAVDDALANGLTMEQFKKNLRPTLEQKGWWGIKTMVDPATGEERDVRLGTPRRLKTIYETNMRTAYAAGRWEQVQRTKDVFKYLRYVAVMDGRERPAHRALNDIVKPVDDPFWDDHYPPNGWGCRCTVQQLTEDDVKRLGLEVARFDPRMPDRTVMNTRTGERMRVPQGIDAGFNYNPGKARMKALTPPPVDRPLEVPYAGDPAKVAMPAPRPAPQRNPLPDDTDDEGYVRSFLSEFGSDIGKSKAFIDVTGEPLIISDDLFRDRNGRWKVAKYARNKHLPLMAAAIREPDEIWHVWEEREGQPPVLRRRYIARFTDGKSQGIAVFDTGKDGWTGVTTFQSKDKSYIEKQRRGALVYRRPDDRQ